MITLQIANALSQIAPVAGVRLGQFDSEGPKKQYAVKNQQGSIKKAQRLTKGRMLKTETAMNGKTGIKKREALESQLKTGQQTLKKSKGGKPSAEEQEKPQSVQMIGGVMIEDPLAASLTGAKQSDLSEGKTKTKKQMKDNRNKKKIKLDAK